MKYKLINPGINLIVNDFNLPIQELKVNFTYWQNEVIARCSEEFFCSENFHNFLIKGNYEHRVKFYSVPVTKDYEMGWEGHDITLPIFYYMKINGQIGINDIFQINHNLFLSENILEKIIHLFEGIIEFDPFIGDLLVSTSNGIKQNSLKSYYKIKLEKNCKKVGNEIFFKKDKILYLKQSKNHICLTIDEPTMQNTIDFSYPLYTMELMTEIANFENLMNFNFIPKEQIYFDIFPNELPTYYHFAENLKSIFIQNNELYIQTELYEKIKHLLPEATIDYILNIEAYNLPSDSYLPF
jgi:hypothetical protein